MERMVEKRYAVTPNNAGAGDERRWTVRGRRLLLSSLSVSDRFVVLWEDLPSGAASGVIDLRAVVLTEP
jgi:hypothetical protein